MKILVIDDDGMLCDIIAKVLKNNDYVVEVTSSGEEGLYLAEQHPYDAIILDVILPEMDGFALLKRLRKKEISTPVIFLTSRQQLEDRVEGLGLGADDYLVKPFEMPELLARLSAIIRRGKKQASPIVEIGEVKIDTGTRSVVRGKDQVVLTRLEFNLLEYLARNVGRVISRSELVEHLYHRDFSSDSNLIDVHVTNLRTKLDKPYPQKLIRTVRGAGFMIQAS
ncbi:MAG: response regulator transcription factor [Nitrospirota bacterium]|nr:response regulator transcription factor [Nitrospirota bacterium]